MNQPLHQIFCIIWNFYIRRKIEFTLKKKTMQQINTNLCMAKINHLAVMNTSKKNKLKFGHQNLTNN